MLFAAKLFVQTWAGKRGFSNRKGVVFELHGSTIQIFFSIVPAIVLLNPWLVESANAESQM